ncbi:MAG TPA: glycosyltransferase family 39 protein [Actinomadura sp.]|nr:glycosyltransferase family 39 protein [Actinomadura sp.]
MTTSTSAAPAHAGPVSPERRSLAHRLARGRPGDPSWARPALLGLLTGTAVLYLWGLGASGWANSFYSAAIQAGATSWKAFFFGSSDASDFITVDKPPAALWPPALVARVFGLGPWSVLVPQALMGVATVGVLHATVRRTLTAAIGESGAAGAALLAGTAQALTPVAVLMFRFNNPDALLVLLLTLGAYGMVRAQEGAATRWIVFAGCCAGFGFLAKMLQAFLVVPGFGLVYALAAPAPLRRRLWQLALAGAGMVVAAGWWVLIAAAVPASSRPYIGGSQHNSVLELTLGYNGFGRLTGDETGGLGNTDRQAGWTRLFAAELGGQISWLLPAALILLAAGLWTTRRAPRADPLRAAFLLWGSWLLVTGGVFSFMRGIFHAYYAVALAPPIAALVGMGTAVLWRRRRERAAAVLLPATVAVTAVWSYVLLGRTPEWHPWLPVTVLAAGLVGTLGLAAGRPNRWGTPAVAAAAVAGSAAATLAGPAAYALDTAGTPHRGAIPSAGPSHGGWMGRGGPGGRPPGRLARGGQGAGPGGQSQGPGGFGGRPGGMGRRGNPGNAPGVPGGGGPGAMGRSGGRGPGGLLDAAAPNAELTALLKKGGGAYTWVAAAAGSNTAAGLQLATGRPVMAVGGFNGTDPAPAPARFQRYVAAGRIHYFIGDGMIGGPRAGGGGGGSDYARRIAEWVRTHFTATTVAGTTVYDLTRPRS